MDEVNNIMIDFSESLGFATYTSTSQTQAEHCVVNSVICPYYVVESRTRNIENVYEFPFVSQFQINAGKQTNLQTAYNICSNYAILISKNIKNIGHSDLIDIVDFDYDVIIGGSENKKDIKSDYVTCLITLYGWYNG